MHPLVIGTALLQAPLAAEIAGVLQDPEVDVGRVSVYVKVLGGDTVYSLSPDTPLIPASTMKIVTAAYAFHVLGPDYSPTTLAWREGDSVYLAGGGDPGLEIEELEALAAAVGVTSADKVYFDDQFLGAERYAPTWPQGDIRMGYGQPISALTVNGGRAEVWVEGDRAFFKPRNFGLTIVPRLSRGGGGVRVDHDSRAWAVGVTGGAKDGPIRVDTVVLPDPGLCAARVFAPQAQRSPNLSPPPPGGPPISLVRARTIESLCAKMLTESNNTYAETLFRVAGKFATGSGAWSDAARGAEAFLRSRELMPGTFRVADGSGLSRANRLSARSLASLLEQTLLSGDGTRFLRCLATPGSGTLRSRLAGCRVWAKTGTLTGASSLAGMVECVDSEGTVKRYVFAILMNDYKSSAASVRAVQDKIVKCLATPVANEAPLKRKEVPASAFGR